MEDARRIEDARRFSLRQTWERHITAQRDRIGSFADCDSPARLIASQKIFS